MTQLLLLRVHPLPFGTQYSGVLDRTQNAKGMYAARKCCKNKAKRSTQKEGGQPYYLQAKNGRLSPLSLFKSQYFVACLVRFLSQKFNHYIRLNT